MDSRAANKLVREREQREKSWEAMKQGTTGPDLSEAICDRPPESLLDKLASIRSLVSELAAKQDEVRERLFGPVPQVTEKNSPMNMAPDAESQLSEISRQLHQALSVSGSILQRL